MHLLRLLLSAKRCITTIILSVIAVFVEYFYTTCAVSCQSFKGDIFGIELQYVGILFMVTVIALSFLDKRKEYLLSLLSAGIGVEIYLVGFQIWHSSYCLYCLVFGAILALQFLINFVNYERERKWLVLLPMAVALVFFSVFFEGSVLFQYDLSAVSFVG